MVIRRSKRGRKEELGQKELLLECRIWAFEETPYGTHWCHAPLKGLWRDLYPRSEIDRILKEKATGPGSRWVIMACETNHPELCGNCKYLNRRGMAKYIAGAKNGA